MNFARGLMTIVIGGLIAYVVADSIVKTIITGTSTGDQLVQNLLTLIIASVLMLAVVVVGFKEAGA